MPLGNPLPSTIQCQEQVLREFIEDMIFLGIRDDSGIAWKLVKGSDFSPIMERLYKGLRAHK